MKKISLEGGKYIVCHDNGTDFHALRYGERWRDLTGDNLIFSLVSRIEDLESAQEGCALVSIEALKQIETGLSNFLFDAASNAAMKLNVQLAQVRSMIAGAREPLPEALVRAEPEPDKECKADDGCPTELAVLKRFWRDNKPRKCQSDMYSDPPRDCDYPFCGCDPAIDKVMATLSEMNLLRDRFEAPSMQSESIAINELLTDVCQILDVVKAERAKDNSWSDWDQSVRDRASQYLQAFYTAPHTDAAPLAVPEWCVIVPIEPTVEMLQEAVRFIELGIDGENHPVYISEGEAANTYKAMIAAAPPAEGVADDNNNHLLRECLDALSDFDHDKRVAVCVKLRALLGVE